MQTPIDGAAIVQREQEDEAAYASRPGVIPQNVENPWKVGDPFNPLTATKDHDATDDTWDNRDPSDIYIVYNQTYLAMPTTIGFGAGFGAIAVTPRDTFIPGKN